MEAAKPKPRKTALKEPVEQERRVELVTHVPHVCHITVPIAPQQPEAQADVVSVLESLDRARIKISLLKIHEGFMDFVVEGDCTPEHVEQVLKRQVTVINDCAIVILKSDSIRYLPGIIATAVQVLYEKKIEVYATGDSYDSLFIVIDGTHLQRAVTALMKGFRVEPT